MPKYYVEVVRTFVGAVEIEANDEYAARDSARELDLPDVDECNELEAEYVIYENDSAGEPLLRS